MRTGCPKREVTCYLGSSISKTAFLNKLTIIKLQRLVVELEECKSNLWRSSCKPIYGEHNTVRTSFMACVPCTVVQCCMLGELHEQSQRQSGGVYDRICIP